MGIKLELPLTVNDIKDILGHSSEVLKYPQSINAENPTYMVKINNEFADLEGAKGLANNTLIKNGKTNYSVEIQKDRNGTDALFLVLPKKVFDDTKEQEISAVYKLVGGTKNKPVTVQKSLQVVDPMFLDKDGNDKRVPVKY